MIVRGWIRDREADRDLVKERRLRQLCPFVPKITPGVKHEFKAADPCLAAPIRGLSVRPSALVVVSAIRVRAP